jgi:Tfp pilus assembly protein PilF
MPLASLNPFSKAESTAAAPPPSGSTPGQLASMRQAATNQVSSVGTAASSAWSKTVGGVSGVFGGSAPTVDQAGNRLADDDPTRLSSPATVSPEVFVAQGALWETTGDFPKAMESYKRALQTDAGNAAALASVARLHMRQENYPEAADHFRKAIAVNPSDPALLNDYGMTQAKLGDLPGASQSIANALQAAPGTSRFANNLANVRYDAGDAAGALAVLMQHNKPAVAHFNMAYLHFRAGNHADAKAQLDHVMQYEALAERDSAVAQALSRSRDMLVQLEGGADRIAQAAPRTTAATTVANASHSPQPGQPTAQAQAMSMPSYGSMPAASHVPWIPTSPSATSAAPASGAATTSNPLATGPSAIGPSGGFVLPPDAFNQTLR